MRFVESKIDAILDQDKQRVSGEARVTETSRWREPSNTSTLNTLICNLKQASRSVRYHWRVNGPLCMEARQNECQSSAIDVMTRRADHDVTSRDSTVILTLDLRLTGWIELYM